MFFWALLVVPSAHGQVIEESGFPVKGGGVSGESFSLFCPSRLYVAAGESVSFACTATAVPEEGVRYAWEAVSGDGLRLLSDAQAPDPLFTAPLSEAAEEYRYRLTGTGAGVYATVTVTVGGLVQGAEQASGVREGECDTFYGFVRDQEGCQPWGKAPFPDFFGEVEDEGIVPWPSFPGSPGAEGGKSFSGAGPGPRTPPYLDCPSAVFLEELQTGSIECYASDASGEEYLDFAWESVGGTTRDYLDNPRLIPEDSPNPSVVAPEAPRYKTLESFHSGETTFRYRYRLTAMSRATGLSSSSEVEVFVSGSRPSVYCPLEVVVEEGATIALDCEGVDPLSGRMDYDEDGASIEWEWSGLWGTSTGLLDGTDLSSPLFTAPPGSAGKTYHYIASMTSSASGAPLTARRRVTVTVTGAEEGAQVVAKDSTSAAGNKPLLGLEVFCDGEFYNGNYYGVSEAAPNFVLDCEASGGPAGATYTYLWTGRAERSSRTVSSAEAVARLSDTAIRDPVFDVPDVPDRDFREYVYNLRASASDGTIIVTTDLAVEIDVVGINSSLLISSEHYFVDEGPGRFMMTQVLTPGTATDYKYSWTGSSGALARLSATDELSPYFDVPRDVVGDTDYNYVFRVLLVRFGIFSYSESVTVTVWDTDPSLTCTDSEVYEGAIDITLDCSVIDEPSGAMYAWTGTDIDNRLTGTDGRTPMFVVPGNVNADTDYEYTVTLSASGINNVTEDVTVTVKNKPQIVLDCGNGPGSPLAVGIGDRDSYGFSCSAAGAPLGSIYSYAWTARDPTPDTDLLSATDMSSTQFTAPDISVPYMDFNYTITATADNAEEGSLDIRIRVRDTDVLAPVVTCNNPDPVYEATAGFTLDCSVTNEPSGATYAWTGTDIAARLSSTTILKPTFHVPPNVNSDTDYEYTVTLSASGIDDVTEDVTVTVLNRPAIIVTCDGNPYEVYEGSADFAFDCSASRAPAGSAYAYEWTPRGATSNTDLLIAGTDGPTPTFSVPDALDVTTTYEYLLTVSAENAESGSAAVTVTVLNAGALRVVCAAPPSVYEGSADFAFDCSASGAPAGSAYVYVWTARGSTSNTDLLIAGTDGPTPMFSVPDALDVTTTYEYLLTVSAENAESGSAAVTVTVLNAGALRVVCAAPPSVYEGSADFAFDCSASGAPAGSAYVYVWTARGSTANTDLLIAGTDGPTPTFSVPDALDVTTTYEYLLTVSAENAESGSAEVTVTALNRGPLSVVCADPPSVYEGSADFELDCSASGAPAGSAYAYVWTARGSTANTDLLIAGTDGPTPTFDVPDALDVTTTYEYLLTVSADNAESGSAEVTVTVLNEGSLRVVCASPASVYEGSDDFAFACSASGAPAGSAYAYVWTARGSTANTALLIAGTDGPTPTFAVPDALDATTTYEYLLTVSAENAESGSAEVTVTVLNRGPLSVVCADPPSVYEGSADFELDCSASGAPAGSAYAYVWAARGSTANTALLIAGTDGPTPTFDVPDALDATTTYEYLLTVSADNAESGSAEVTVTVLNRGPLSVVCADPPSVYEGSADFELDCSASGAPAGSAYAYVWAARGSTANTALLIAGTDGPTPTFDVPDALDATTTYEYLLTVSAENAESGSAEVTVTVTVLNKGALAVVCTDPAPVYEGSADIVFNCSASGAPSGSAYTYAWTARGSTANTNLLTSGTDGPTPTFAVPDNVNEDETYEYLLTASAANAEDATAEVTVTVLDRAPLAFVDDSISGRVYVFTVGESIADILLPQATGGLSPYTYTLTPVLPEGLGLDDPTRTISGTPLEVSPGTEYTWQVIDANAETERIAFFIEVVPAEEPTSVPVTESSSELPEPSALGVTVSASSLDFGVQSAETQVSLDPMTDGISTHVSGPYHVGRMTLSPGGSASFDENGEMALSIEIASPALLRRKDAVEPSSLVLTPVWSYAESCDQLSSQSVGGLYTEVTLSEADCRLLRFGGDMDLTGALPGRYSGSMDIVLRSGQNEEMHTLEVDVTVIPAQRVITIGPGGVRFSASKKIPAGLTEEQNLSIYPDVAFLTEEKPNGVFELSNPSLIPLEISVSARFGYTEATEDGREVVIEDTEDSRLGDLSQVVDIHPGVLVLQPGEKGFVRYGVKAEALTAMTEKGYAAFFDVASSPRQYIDLDRMPEEVTGERTARVTMLVPGAYVSGEGASQLRARLLSLSYGGAMSATFLVETGDGPFVGEVVAYDGDGRELGRRETLVYTRSRVRIPLDRMPEEGTVFLRFSPRGSGRVPDPVTVPWGAPRRDIGAAQDKDRTTTSQAFVRRP